MEGKRFFVAVHVGACYHSPSNDKPLRSAMKRASVAAASLLSDGSGSCLDAVVAAIQVLEDDPCTNAGRGSNLTEDGGVECDASLIDGKSGAFGAVGAVPGIRGADVDHEAMEAWVTAGEVGEWTRLMNPTYESVTACIGANYYGAKNMCETLIPLLKFSDSPRIVNVSSTRGNLELIPDERAKGVLNDVENLTDEKLDELLNQFLKDFKEKLLETKSWTTGTAAYRLSKAALNAYTRILAKKYPTFYINAVCPGYCKTDLNYHNGYLTVEEGAQSVVRLALLPDGGPSGLFFSRSEVAPF